VDPVDHQGSFAELDDGAETLLRETPAAPRVDQEQNDKKNAAAHQKKIRAAVPVVVDRVGTQRGGVKKNGKRGSENSGDAQSGENQSLILPGNSSKKKKADGESGKGERGPGEKREKPRLRLMEDVDAIDVGLEWPREPVRAKSCPQRRRGRGDSGGSEKTRENPASAGRSNVHREIRGVFGGEPTEDAHEDHGEAKDIEDVDAEKIGPRGVGVAKRVFLKSKEQS